MIKEEWENWIRIYGRQIYSFCRYLTHDREEADDLYQDTFLTAIRQQERILSGESAKGYLLAIAMNLYKNRKKKFAVRNRIVKVQSLGEEEAVIPDQETAPLEKCLKQEEERKVREAVNSLSDKYRLPVLLYYMEDMELSSIASLMKLPVGTVKSRLYHARMLLKKKLEVVLNE